ncbi:MAG: ABC transporter substrate-binding protein [Trueperaceae bacterium]|nr:ABC transporter substrate-binding protein [Trueperaceae bacterium]
MRQPLNRSRAARFRAGLVGLALLGLLLPGRAAAQGEVRVYAVINDDDTRLLADMFTAETGIKVSYLRASTGELVSRVIAEAGAPQADVLLGGPSAQHIAIAETGALAVYRPAAAAALPAYAVSPEGYWTGFYLTALGIGVNVDRFHELFPGHALPATWDDLLDPAFKGEIVMTDPVSSSTAYLFVQAQLQRLGWDAGWAYLEKLAPLVGQFPASGGAPPQLVGTGEYAIGVAYVHALVRYRHEGFPITTIVPPATAGEVGAVSIVAGGPNPDNARRFVDFVLSAKAEEAFAAQSFTTPLNPDAAVPEGATASFHYDFIDYDAELAGEQRDEVLLRWQQVVD